MQKSRLKKFFTTLSFLGIAGIAAIPTIACLKKSETFNSVWDILGNKLLISDEQLQTDLDFSKILKGKLPSSVAIEIDSQVIVDLVKKIDQIKKLDSASLSSFTSENVNIKPDDANGTFTIVFSFGEKQRELIIPGFLTNKSNQEVNSLFEKINLITSKQLASTLLLNPSLQELPSEVSLTNDEVIEAVRTIISQKSSPSETILLRDDRMTTKITKDNEAGSIVVQIIWSDDFAAKYTIEGFASITNQEALNQKIKNLTSENFLAQINFPPEVTNQLPSKAVQSDLSPENVARIMQENLVEINTLEDDVKNLLTADMISFETDDENGLLKIIISYQNQKLKEYNLQSKYQFYSLGNIYNDQIWNEVIEQASQQDIADALGIKTASNQLPSNFQIPDSSETNAIIKKIRGYSDLPPDVKNYTPQFDINLVKANDNEGKLEIKITSRTNNLQEKQWTLEQFASLNNLDKLKSALDSIDQSSFDSQIGISWETRSQKTAIKAVQNELTSERILQLMKTNLIPFKSLSADTQMLITGENIQVTPLNDQGVIVVDIQIDKKTWTFQMTGFMNGAISSNLNKLKAGIQSVPNNQIIEAISSYQTDNGISLDKSYLPVAALNAEIINAEVITKILKNNLSLTAEIKNLLMPEMIQITPNLNKGSIKITVNISGDEVTNYFFEGFESGDDSWIAVYADAINQITPEQITNIFSNFINPSEITGELTKTTASYAAEVINQGLAPLLLKGIKSLPSFSKMNLNAINAFTKMWYTITSDDSTGTLQINFTNNISGSQNFEINGFLNNITLETAKTTVFNTLNAQKPPTELFNALNFDLYNLDSDGTQPQDLTSKNKAALEINHLRDSWIEAQITDINRLGSNFSSLFYDNPVLSRNDISQYIYSSYVFNGYSPDNEENQTPIIDAQINLILYDPSYDAPANKGAPSANDHVLLNLSFSTLDFEK